MKGTMIIAIITIATIDHFIKTEKKYLAAKKTFLVFFIYIPGI